MAARPHLPPQFSGGPLDGTEARLDLATDLLRAVLDELRGVREALTKLSLEQPGPEKTSKKAR